MQFSQECVETRTKQSEHACRFLRSQTSARVHVPRVLHFFAVRTKESKTYAQDFFYENAWICARSTTHHDLVSVIPDKKRERGRGRGRGKRKGKRERERKEEKRKETMRKREKCKYATVAIFCGHIFLFKPGSQVPQSACARPRCNFPKP